MIKRQTSEEYWTDQTNLKQNQYRTDENLATRQNIYVLFGTATQPWAIWLLNLAHLESGAKVADIGCGNGRIWTTYFVANPYQNIDLTLVDLSAGMLPIAREAVANHVVVSQAVQGSAMNLPLPDAHFDCLFANHMLYHVPDPEQGVAEFSRVLNTRGQLILTLNEHTHFQALWDLLDDLLKPAKNIRVKPLAPAKGELILQTYFQKVTKHIYSNPLQITDAQVLWDYLASTDVLKKETTDPSTLTSLKEAFLQKVETIIKRDGHFHIETGAVAFICSNDA